MLQQHKHDGSDALERGARRVVLEYAVLGCRVDRDWPDLVRWRVSFLLLGVPLLVLFQLVRRQPLRTLWARDTDSFARGWAGKLLVAAVLIVILTLRLLQSLRLDRYANDSWTALVMAAVLAGGYLVTRRLLLTVTIAALVVVATSWMLTPNLATARNGDPVVLAHLEEQNSMGMLNGSTTSPSPRSTWTRRIQCSWPALVLQPRHRWRSGR
jgi:hypothetical protein